MKREVITTAKSVEDAVARGALQLGVDKTKVTYEVITEPKKGFLGIGEVPAKVKVIYNIAPEELALNFVRTLISNMGLNAIVSLSDGENGEKIISVTGDEAGILIGYHGETLESLQFLANLAANKKDGEDDDREFTKIIVDIENYREKRVETLRELARRMANKVLKYKRSITLEPMSPYERRIIHSEIQNIKGVTTNSIGSDNNRRIVISLDGDTAKKKKDNKK